MKKMVKYINTCFMCDHCRVSFASEMHKDCYECGAVDQKIDDIDVIVHNGFPEIPEWCPLEDVEENK